MAMLFNTGLISKCPVSDGIQVTGGILRKSVTRSQFKRIGSCHRIPPIVSPISYVILQNSLAIQYGNCPQVPQNMKAR